MFGWRKEEELRGRLVGHLGEHLEKTAWRYDSIDFSSPNWIVELKSRLPRDKNGRPQLRTNFDTWLLPATKVDAAKRDKRRARFYYYWDADKSLWWMDYDSADWEAIERSVPWFHKDEHYFVPAELWQRVEI